MQEHPIPQDITNYRFHIIGSMTLKQFGEVLIGVLVAVVFYNTNLIAFIKWPLILISVGMGAAAAFVPFEERPLDHWIITFFKVLYKPTKFFWRREQKIPEAFSFTPRQLSDVQEPKLNLAPVKQQRIKEYISSVQEIEQSTSGFSQDELSRMSSILDSFTTVTVANTSVVAHSEPVKPKLDVRVRTLRKPTPQQEIIIFDDQQTVQNIQATSQPKIYEDPLSQDSTVHEEIKKVHLATDQVAQNIEIPQQEAIKASDVVAENENSLQLADTSNDPSQKSFVEQQQISHAPIGDTQAATYNQNLPFPIKPTEPNKVVGMVLNAKNELLSESIVEVQTLEGNIERAVKTNALGQFFITTPLSPGEYNVVVEKAGYTFHPQHIKINNTIVPPLEIRSQN